MLRRHLRWDIGLCAALALSLTACGGSDSPTSPTPPPPPPPTLSISCPVDATGTSRLGQPVVVTWPEPTVVGGQPPVTTKCEPASGSAFPIGTTKVTCTASDSAAQSSSCSFSVVITAAPRLTATTFLAFGDSLTQGVVSPPPPTVWQPTDWPSGYPFKLSDLLRARYTDQTLTVLNDGFWGETVDGGLERLPYEVRYYKPEVLLLLEGANDLLADQTDATVNHIRDGLQGMIHVARQNKPGIIVLLATFPPQYAGSRGQGRFQVGNVNGKITSLATTEAVILVDLYKDFTATGTRLIGEDGLHPTDAGFTQMAKSFYNVIQANLEVKTPPVQGFRR